MKNIFIITLIISTISPTLAQTSGAGSIPTWFKPSSMKRKKVGPWMTQLPSHKGPIGINFFEKLAKNHHYTVCSNPRVAGIVDDMKNLAGPLFDPSKVSPLIKLLYTQTSRFKITKVSTKWNRLARSMLWFFNKGSAKYNQQGIFPTNNASIKNSFASEFKIIDHDNDGVQDYVGWVRHYGENKTPLFVATHKIYQQHISLPDSDQDLRVGLMSATVPFRDFTITAVFLPKNDSADGIQFSTAPAKEIKNKRIRTSLDNGEYFYLNRRKPLVEGRDRVSRISFFNEYVHAFPKDEKTISAKQKFLVGSITALELTYQFTLVESAEKDSASNCP